MQVNGSRLPEGQMGNSEVGHLNMGAGRIIYQELTKITKRSKMEISFENQALLAACKNAKENNTALHMMGLVSDGGTQYNGHITYLRPWSLQRDRCRKSVCTLFPGRT